MSIMKPNIPPGPLWVQGIIHASDLYMRNTSHTPPANLIMHTPRHDHALDVEIVDLEPMTVDQWGGVVKRMLRERKPNGYLIIAPANGRRVERDDAERVMKDARREGLKDDPLAGEYVVILGAVFGVGKFAYRCPFERDDDGNVTRFGEWVALDESALIMNIGPEHDQRFGGANE